MDRTALKGAGLLEKARSMIARAKEDMEDLIAEASFSETTNFTLFSSGPYTNFYAD